MPKRVEKKFYTPPPIDWLWAAILERKAQYGWDLKKMAEVAGVSYPVMRNLARKSPWEWSKSARENVCDAFGLELKFGSGNVRIKENVPWQNM